MSCLTACSMFMYVAILIIIIIESGKTGLLIIELL